MKLLVRGWPNETLLLEKFFTSFYVYTYIYRNPIIISDKMIDGPDRIECRAIQFE